MLLVASTTSDSGKSTVTALLVRLLEGFPFKAQNMSLNSFPTRDWGEIAFAQAFQAMASGLEPKREMNAVLLKPSGQGLVEVVKYGRPLGVFSYDYYYSRIVPRVRKELSLRRDMVIEGAGGIEPNFVNKDLATIEVMKRGAPTVLVLNIDPGGAFTSAYGAYLALPPSLRGRLKGFIINKLRGDPKFVESGAKWLERRTGMRYLGYLPYLDFPTTMPEDSMNVYPIGQGGVRVAVVAYPYMSNFNELWALRDSEVRVEFVKKPKELRGADLVVLPGAKNVFEALKWLRERGFEEELKGKKVMAICGGYQLLTQELRDVAGLESGVKGTRVSGLGLIPQRVVYRREKVLSISTAEAGGEKFEGYEIRRGTIYGREFYSIIVSRNDETVEVPDGYYDGRVFATSLHGTLFSEGGKRAFRELTGVEVKAKTMEEEAKAMVDELIKIASSTLDLDYLRELWANSL